MNLTPEQLKLTPEELRKDILARTAISILQQIDPSFEFQWVKADTTEAKTLNPPITGMRRIIQQNG
jgi:hypothetical protein